MITASVNGALVTGSGRRNRKKTCPSDTLCPHHKFAAPRPQWEVVARLTRDFRLPPQFWVVTQCRILGLFYQPFGAAYRSYLQGQAVLYGIGLPSWCHYQSRHCYRWPRFPHSKGSVETCRSSTTRVDTQAGRGQLECDGTRAETRFRHRRNGRVHLNRRGVSFPSTTGSRGVGISGSNAGYIMFLGSVKGTGYPLHLPVSHSFPLPCVTMCHHISTGVYLFRQKPNNLLAFLLCAFAVFLFTYALCCNTALNEGRSLWIHNAQ